jgi:hypothetical protein
MACLAVGAAGGVCQTGPPEQSSRPRCRSIRIIMFGWKTSSNPARARFLAAIRARSVEGAIKHAGGRVRDARCLSRIVNIQYIINVSKG